MAKLCIGEGKLKNRLYNYNRDALVWLLNMTNNYSNLYSYFFTIKKSRVKKKKISSENLRQIHQLRQWQPCNRLWRKRDG